VALAVSPTNGRVLVASGSWDKTVRVWDAISTRPVGEPLTAHSNAVISVAMCVLPSDGRVIVASASWTSQCVCGTWPQGEPFAAHRDAASCVALCVSPSGAWPGLLIASGSDDSTVRLWDAGGALSLLPPDGAKREGTASTILPHVRLLWASRSEHQALDTQHAGVHGAKGLTEAQLALVGHCDRVYEG
jgi:WD40 repeat protein